MESFKKQSWSVHLVGGLLVVLIIVVSTILIVRAASNRSDDQPAPTSTATTQQVLPSAWPSIDTTEIDGLRDSLLERVEEFSVVYYSYDWSNTTGRTEKLQSYLLPAMAADFVEQEANSPIRQRMIAAKDMKTVESVNAEYGEIGENLELAEVIAEVRITTAAAGEEPITFPQPSHTLWALLDNKWYVYEIVR